MIRAFAYDMPRSLGLLAKQVVWHERMVTPLPPNTVHSYQQWAGWSVRYATAWDNWNLTLRVWKSQFDEGEPPIPYVTGWGGGVALAELLLAKHVGYHTALITSSDQRIAVINRLGITPIDRRGFLDLDFLPERYESDREYRRRYLKAESQFLEAVTDVTAGQGASIFIDNIGASVYRATLRALGRLGVVTTAGWRSGKQLSHDRVAACVGRHLFVHTHGFRRSAVVQALPYSEKHAWVPPPEAEEYSWDDVPQLADDYESGRTQSYAPVFQVNPV
jgi:NADPH:quinone reductase-like Zn-dependent oxidoreductase